MNYHGQDAPDAPKEYDRWIRPDGSELIWRRGQWFGISVRESSGEDMWVRVTREQFDSITVALAFISVELLRDGVKDEATEYQDCLREWTRQKPDDGVGSDS